MHRRSSVHGKRLHKKIECAFGVLQCKFQILCHPLEKWDEQRINQTVMACILMHNMMVQECMDSESDLFGNFCGMYDPDDELAINRISNRIVIKMMVMMPLLTLIVTASMMMLLNTSAVLKQKCCIDCRSLQLIELPIGMSMMVLSSMSNFALLSSHKQCRSYSSDGKTSMTLKNINVFNMPLWMS